MRGICYTTSSNQLQTAVTSWKLLFSDQPTMRCFSYHQNDLSVKQSLSVGSLVRNTEHETRRHKCRTERGTGAVFRHACALVTLQTHKVVSVTNFSSTCSTCYDLIWPRQNRPCSEIVNKTHLTDMNVWVNQ